MLNPLDAFNVEAWTYCGIDILIVFARFFGRWRTLGFRNLAPDDFLMVVAVLLYTAETATAYWVGAFWQGIANSGMTDDERAALDPLSHEYHLRVKGSQTQLFGWAVYTVLLWCLKLCWLFFYKRLGDGVDNMTLKINIGFVFVIATFFGTFFTIIFGCFPVQKHWQIYPDPGNFCQPAVSKLQAWTLITTNLSTDFYIMTIPLPMVWNARIPLLQKIGLIVMFCGGILTAVFGGLRCGFVLQDSVNGPQLAGEWSCRESFVAVFISNLPVLLPMINRSCHRMREMKTGASGGSGSGGGKGGKGGAGGGGAGSSKNKGGVLNFMLSTISGKPRDKKKFKHPLSLPGETFYEMYGSEEDIIENGVPVVGNKETEDSSKPVKDITVTTEWQVQSQTLNSMERKEELHNTVNGYQNRQSQRHG